jgi:hydrophobic/amphiphilic exporter-1 (mainly G- bacteria), HAE1 family
MSTITSRPKLAQQISQVPGVAQVTIGGQQKPAIRIQLDPAKLVAKGSSLEDVRTPLSVTTVDEPKGAIDSGARSFTIYTNDQLTRAKDWNDTIVAYRNGAPLRVSDIGQAVIGPQRHQSGGLGRCQAERLPRHLQAAGRKCH